MDRWEYSESDEKMKPVISRLHIIPLEESPTLIHCAQADCWCFPAPDADDPAIITHNAATKEPEGWVVIGERLPD